MPDNVTPFRPPQPPRLELNGSGRDKDHDKALVFYFNRPPTGLEMQFLHECLKRAMPLL